MKRKELIKLINEMARDGDYAPNGVKVAGTASYAWANGRPPCRDTVRSTISRHGAY